MKNIKIALGFLATLLGSMISTHAMGPVWRLLPQTARMVFKLSKRLCTF